MQCLEWVVVRGSRHLKVTLDEFYMSNCNLRKFGVFEEAAVVLFWQPPRGLLTHRVCFRRCRWSPPASKRCGFRNVWRTAMPGG